MQEQNEKFRVMDILGVEGLFLEDRQVLFTKRVFDIPDDFNLYDLRGGREGDPGAIATVEDGVVVVNYCGTFFSKEELPFDRGMDYIELNEDNWGFTDEEMTIDEYLKRE